METTFYAFLSNIRSFLGNLLKNPLTAEPSKFLKERGFSKKKLIHILIKKDVLKRHEKINNKNTEENGITYEVTYKVVRHQFERKIRRLYNKYFESNDDAIEETTCCGASSGQYSMPLFGAPIRQKIATNESVANKQKKGRNIFITEEQYNVIKEAFGLGDLGSYQYDVPFPVKKNDPSLIHRKKGGILCDRLK